jgi:hypothetical protein
MLVKEYRYYTYGCQQSNELRGKRLSWRDGVTDPCGRTSLLRTSTEVTHSSKHQTKCIYCGNRPRLTPANTTLHLNQTEALRAFAQAKQTEEGEE